MTELAAALIWVSGIIVWTIIRWPHRRKAKRLEVIDDRKTGAEKFVLGLCIVGLVALPALHLATPIFEFANFRFSPILGWFGLLSMVAFLVVFHLSHKYLSNNWSVSLEIRKDHKLVEDGIYKYIRHPMYTSFWLWSVAQMLLMPNWVAATSGLISVAWLYFSRVKNEEAMMRAQFGQAYDAYCKRTSRLFPKFF